ncbi:MAG: transcriptional regulator [Nocardiopsaceae bacterium]|nr:transcriptional regulator [Nocardiopsaceae bacterium]
MPAAVTFAVAFAALSAGHWLADYWIQRHSQALRKALPGWAGRRACAGHVASYTLTLGYALAIACTALDVPLSWPHLTAGLGFAAVTHYLADRREPLRRIAARLGKAEYWDDGGAPALDQSAHWACLFIAALFIAA